MSISAIGEAATAHGMMVMGICPDDDGSIRILIGAGQGFWPIFKASPEYGDGCADPLDRWSCKVIDAIARDHQGKAIYPSDGPPYPPFISWALRSGRFWQSPVGMMVHDTAGLMISIRGAIQLEAAEPMSANMGVSPCETCAAQPCVAACPVGALSQANGYDVARCRSYLDTPDGADCMTNGCKARRACPVSQGFDRPAEQSAFHMRAFHPQ